ncbi:MAG: flagellar biosynthesis anti-sigma factor FlgM [Deltaproteobacteria bacterium]|jgi:flagellar biosynthesis anti-sigma factor FlgM|nr:flagellar biosynthesis anti-sigma factor FlgM [Deltaproteobacteria bacterium]
MEIKKTLSNPEAYLSRLEENAKNVDRQLSGKNEGASGISDTVEIRSSSLKEAVMEEAAASPDIRADKVDELKSRIAAGDYRIDSRILAVKMLRTEGEFLR